MRGQQIRTGRWPVPRRRRVRVRLGRYVVVGRFARIAPRAAGPPGRRWGLASAHGRVGYGAAAEDGAVEYWRPLSPLE